MRVVKMTAFGIALKSFFQNRSHDQDQVLLLRVINDIGDHCKPARLTASWSISQARLRFRFNLLHVTVGQKPKKKKNFQTRSDLHIFGFPIFGNSIFE